VFAAHGSFAGSTVIPVGGGRSTFLLKPAEHQREFSRCACRSVRKRPKGAVACQDTKPRLFLPGSGSTVTLSATLHEPRRYHGHRRNSVDGVSANRFTVGKYPVALAAQDFNNDSQKDLAVVNQQDNSVSILLINQGNGNFSQREPCDCSRNERDRTGGDWLPACFA